jgi:hypothetical protein
MLRSCVSPVKSQQDHFLLRSLGELTVAEIWASGNVSEHVARIADAGQFSRGCSLPICIVGGAARGGDDCIIHVFQSGRLYDELKSSVLCQRLEASP